MGIYIGVGNYIGSANLRSVTSIIRVIDRESSLPLVGAIVIFNGEKYIADINGQVILKGFSNRRYPLTIERGGYESVIIDKWRLKDVDIYLTDNTMNIITENGADILSEDGKFIIIESNGI